MENLRIQPAAMNDVPLLLTLIGELAEQVAFPFEVSVTQADLRNNLFGERPAAEAVIGYVDDEPASFAVYYQTFSTATGKPGLHLDDLYVRPAFQNRGIGSKMLAYLAETARQRGCVRFEWWVLEWNDRAMGFYESLGAQKLEELRIFRLGQEEIRHISEPAGQRE